MVAQRKKTVQESIAEVNELANRIQTDENFNIELLDKAVIESHDLMRRLNDLLIHVQQQELQEFLDQMLRIVEQLHQITQDQVAGVPPPNKILDTLSRSFEKFFNETISKEHQEQLRVMIDYVPYVNNIVYCCETMPYFWAYTNRAQKVAMVLGATLIVTALVLAVATAATPAFPALPIVGSIALVFSRIGKVLYNRAIVEPEQKYEDNKVLNKVKTALDEQYEFFESTVTKGFGEQKPLKQVLVHTATPKAKLKQATSTAEAPKSAKSKNKKTKTKTKRDDK